MFDAKIARKKRKSDGLGMINPWGFKYNYLSIRNDVSYGLCDRAQAQSHN